MQLDQETLLSLNKEALDVAHHLRLSTMVITLDEYKKYVKRLIRILEEVKSTLNNKELENIDA